jgi:hypothetical protein
MNKTTKPNWAETALRSYIGRKLIMACLLERAISPEVRGASSEQQRLNRAAA